MISDDSTIYVASRRQMYIPKYWERLIWYVKEAAPLKDPNLNEYGKQIKFPSDFLFFLVLRLLKSCPPLSMFCLLIGSDEHKFHKIY